jgi:hypothetical protein
MDQATVGRIVHYTYAVHDLDAEHQHLVGESRPAIVVRVWPNEFGQKDGYNLQVFTDGANDGKPIGLHWATSRELVEEPAPGKCHWPKRS